MTRTKVTVPSVPVLRLCARAQTAFESGLQFPFGPKKSRLTPNTRFLRP